MIVLRTLTWPEDRAPLLALDTSFTSDRVYRLQQTGRSFTLSEVAVSQPIYKSYSLAGEVEGLASFDWIQVASEGEKVVGLVCVKVEGWNRRQACTTCILIPQLAERDWGAQWLRLR